MALFKKSMRMIAKAGLIASLILTSNLSTQASEQIIEVIRAVETRLDARVGVAMFNVKNSETLLYKANERFPLNSTFKSFACGALLHKVDIGLLNLQDTQLILEDDLVTWSPVTKKHVGKHLSYAQLCKAAITMSDNTAANKILLEIDGPIGFTRYMKIIDDDITRIDRMEPELNEGVPGDERDTTTPLAAIGSLNRLLFDDILSDQSKQQLTQWMMDNRVADSLIRSVLPDGWKIADKSGGGGHGSRGIIAAIWPDNEKPVLVAIYLTQTKADFKSRNAAFAEIGAAIISHLQK
jgi:beta-lactamase class A